MYLAQGVLTEFRLVSFPTAEYRASMQYGKQDLFQSNCGVFLNNNSISFVFTLELFRSFRRW